MTKYFDRMPDFSIGIMLVHTRVDHLSQLLVDRFDTFQEFVLIQYYTDQFRKVTSSPKGNGRSPESHYKYMGTFQYIYIYVWGRSRAANSTVSVSIWLKYKLIQPSTHGQMGPIWAESGHNAQIGPMWVPYRNFSPFGTHIGPL